MGKKLPPDQLALYKRIDEIPFYKWDPIGVSDIEEARDEYYSCLPQVFSIALESAQPTKIANYLSEVASGSMGLEGSPEHDLAIAKEIIKAKNQCLIQ
ncbi:hypothetical protein SAMN05216271_3287 [Halopseudomonas sabulinigri]|uniref:Uncharacterized protein n=1 Tax=Halopseudomonas sabulinigri TaxID=472181 RepID=A0A1H1WRX6_9GAMM|nr:hypothetical protein [Halopseudomonas sabulinigri]SDS98939.1 hypothetical protein SAMN05216271_3287 [Halopseudomonas sabulinigri]